MQYAKLKVALAYRLGNFGSFLGRIAESGGRQLVLGGVAAFAIASVSAAHADVITTYTASGIVFGRGGIVTGSFQYDDTTLSLVTGSSTIQMTGEGMTPGGAVSGLNRSYNNLYIFGDLFEVYGGETKQGAEIFFKVGAPPIQVGSIDETNILAAYGYVFASETDYAVSGVLNASTPGLVPEPSSIALIGVGLAGIGVSYVRRHKKV